MGCSSAWRPGLQWKPQHPRQCLDCLIRRLDASYGAHDCSNAAEPTEQPPLVRALLLKLRGSAVNIGDQFAASFRLNVLGTLQRFAQR